MVVKELLAFSAKIDKMRKFVMLNTLAVIKITKKHDKQSQRPLQSEMVNSVHKRHFYNSGRFSSLIIDSEVLTSQVMYRLTGARPQSDIYSCPICLGILCNPVVLSCGHRYCMKCVSAASYFCQTSCPVCRKEQILDMENIKVDTLLSHFLDRYFPEGTSGVKQCRTCAGRRLIEPGGSRQRLPCEECNLQVLEAIEEMQTAALKETNTVKEGMAVAGGTVEAGGVAGASASTAERIEFAQTSTALLQVTSSSIREKRRLAADSVTAMEVRPRLKRRSVGAGGKQALGGRPEENTAVQAAPIVLNPSTLRAHFNLPLNDAARQLGVCATAIKKVCRKMGIMQWPHRKLKAVEKRLALLQVEVRDASDSRRAEVQDLEQKRDALLQGVDCDIGAIVEGKADEVRDSGERAGSRDNGDANTDADGTFRQHAVGEHTMDPQPPPPPTAMAHEGYANDVTRQNDGPKRVLPMGVRAPPPESSASGWSFDAGDDKADDGQDMDHLSMLHGDSYGYNGENAQQPVADEAEQDVWAMLHRMMGEPEAHEHGTGFANVTSPPPRQQMDAQVVAPFSWEQGADTAASSSAMKSATNMFPKRSKGSMGAEVVDADKHVLSLEEEVVHLRQFSIALMRERGDLAIQVQRRDEEISNLRHQCSKLESELAYFRDVDQSLGGDT